MNNSFNGVSLNGGGVFGINKHVYSYYRFATDKVVVPKGFPDSTLETEMGGIISTKSEAQSLIDQYLQDPNNNQIYTFYLLCSMTSHVGIYQCFIDIPHLYMNYSEIGFVLNPVIPTDIYNPKVAPIKILNSDDIYTMTEALDFVGDYSEETFIGGIYVHFQ